MATIQDLNDLLDVSVPAPADGDVLYWDAAAAKWKAKPIAVGAGGIVERLIRASSDDCDVRWSGSAWSLSLTIDTWTVGYSSSSNLKKGGAGRFLNIYIPNGATIVHAYFKPTSDSNQANIIVNSRFHGEKNATPLTFSNVADYNARVRTDATVDWDNLPPWTTGTLYQSPDLKTIFQEIVNLPAWVKGNPVVLFWDDHDDRTPHVNTKYRSARQWDAAQRTPCILYIEWTG